MCRSISNNRGYWYVKIAYNDEFLKLENNFKVWKLDSNLNPSYDFSEKKNYTIIRYKTLQFETYSLILIFII